MMKVKLLIGILGTVLLVACSSQVYNNDTYLETNDLSGKTVAVVPVKVEFTGRLPQGYSVQAKTSDEEDESLMIQNLIYSEYLYRSKKNKRKQKPVQLVNPDQVNSRLKNAGVTTRASWEMSPEELGKITGADLVLQIRVRKDRIMSETASLGIGVATTVLGAILNKSGDGIPANVNSGAKTYTINLEATLSDAKNNTVVTRFSGEESASWSHSPETVIKNVNEKIVKKGAIYTR
jgi:hypothetical protein